MIPWGPDRPESTAMPWIYSTRDFYFSDRGILDILFEVSDGIGISQQDTISINVLSVNDAPSFTLDLYSVELFEDFEESPMITILPNIQPEDELDQNIIYTVSTDSIDFIEVVICFTFSLSNASIRIFSSLTKNGLYLIFFPVDGSSNSYVGVVIFGKGIIFYSVLYIAGF